MFNDNEFDGFKKVVKNLSLIPRAKIAQGNTDAPFSIQRIDLALDTEVTADAPYIIGYPFKSIFVQDATDVETIVSLKPYVKDSLQSAVDLTKKDSIVFEYPISKAYLHWDAQAGKTITLIIFVDAEMRSGSQISQNSGGININDGSLLNDVVKVTLSAATAAEIVPQDLNRKLATIENDTGADLYIGASATLDASTNRGIKVADGEKIIFRNTGALFGYSAAGGSIYYMQEE